MKRNSILVVMLALVSLLARGEGKGSITAYFSCDFSDGMPAGAITEDCDGAELHFLMKQAGFAQGDSWKVLYDRANQNYYVGSPSMHKTPKGEEPVPADDRLTLPPVLIRGAEASLKWRCRSVNAQAGSPASTCSVLIDGIEVLAKYEAPIDNWTEASLPLDKYAGKTVTVTFINNTLGGEVLALDDITISGLAGLASVEVVPGEWVMGEESFKPGVTVKALTDEPVTTLLLKCTIGSETLVASADGLDLRNGQTYTLYVDRLFTGRYGDSFSYTLAPVINGTAYDPLAVTTTMLAFRPVKRTVVEESTGQWCGWCPLGIQALAELHEIFGDKVIPVAIHVGQDDMALDEYAAAVGLCEVGKPAAPLGYFDRQTYNGDPMQLLKVGVMESYSVWHGGFATDAEKHLEMQPMVEVSVAASLTEDGAVAVDTSTRSALDMEDAGLKVALVMVEDDVWKKGYYQYNYLAGYPSRGPVGDFMSRPSVITDDFLYQHVARGVAENAYDGIEGSLPASLKAGEPYGYDYKWPIPANVLNPHALKIVAMLIDGDGHIVNAAEAKADPSFTGVSAPRDAVSVKASRGSVEVNGTGFIEARLFDLSGRSVASARGENTLTLKADPGLYILHTGGTALKVRL